MSDRTKRILRLALEEKQFYDEDDSSNDPFSDDSADDPCFLPSDSSDATDSNDSDIVHKQNRVLLVNDNMPGSSQQNASKRPRLVDEVNKEVESEHAEDESQSDVGGEQVVEPIVVEIGNDSQIQLRDLSESVWGPPLGNHLQFNEHFEDTVKPEWRAALGGRQPIDYYQAFVDLSIIDLIVDQTNLYATQFVIENTNVTNNSRVHSWEPTTRTEILHFIGLLGYMGIVRMNSIRDYWSTKWLFKNDVARNVMSRNRFELLLKMLHFSDNTQCPQGDRLYKLQPLLEKLIKNYQTVYTPGKTFCIDETMVPFQGRLLFKQYNPQKCHKYGVKIFKLCCDNGYTWNMSIYAGKEKQNDSLAVSTKIVLNLAKELLGDGRICVTDNWYTSLQLAHILLDNQTHCLGTLRSNRKGNPKEVVKRKLKKGEIIAKENDRGICVLKWRDKREVLILSTYHTDETVQIQRHGYAVAKPKAIMDYNLGKSSIDLSDQMSSYSTALRRTMRWYKKVAIEALLGTSVVNAHFIFKEIEHSDISITAFRYSLFEALMKCEGEDRQLTRPPGTSMRSHVLDKLDCKARENRKYCRGCYKKKMDGVIDKNKVKKVITYCVQCEGNPRYCLECFNYLHKSR